MIVNGSQVKWFFSWAFHNDRGCCFPLCTSDLRDFFQHMKLMGVAPSRSCGWLECAAFRQHVIGVDVEDDYFNDPYTIGMMRGNNYSRPRRKQSRVFIVAGIVCLEQFLSSSQQSYRQVWGRMHSFRDHRARQIGRREAS